jgi:hypothetical protein
MIMSQLDLSCNKGLSLHLKFIKKQGVNILWLLIFAGAFKIPRKWARQISPDFNFAIWQKNRLEKNKHQNFSKIYELLIRVNRWVVLESAKQILRPQFAILNRTSTKQNLQQVDMFVKRQRTTS